MREIKFRGKRVDDGAWVYGYYAPDMLDKSHGEMVDWAFIREFQYINTDAKIVMHQVKKETVGQYIGLHDKNGKEIYEGDIVKWGHLGGMYSEKPVRIAIVKISPDIQFDCVNLDRTFHYGQFAYKDTHNALEVIGNIHENPNLLAGD